jgi:hypothetical protein
MAAATRKSKRVIRSGTQTQDENYEWFVSHRASLVKKHRNLYAVIHARALSGVYPDFDTAVRSSVASGLRPGTFIVQQCVVKEKAVIYCCTPSATFIGTHS